LPPWPEDDPPIDVVLFDLGGVLVELRGVEDMRRLSEIDDGDDVMRRWLECRWVRQFESGGCSAEEFAAGVIADWDLPVGTDAFLESFMGWPRSLFEGAAQLVADTSEARVVACLSNTNALHWESYFERWGLGDLFETVFLSYRLGMVKPDAAIFEHVVGALGVPAERIVLLDDSQLNVDGARSVGMQAARVRGPEEARQELVRLGVLVPPPVGRNDDGGTPRGVRPPVGPRSRSDKEHADGS
jgi:FMN phosphatase YigB (HAD superfamily)